MAKKIIKGPVDFIAGNLKKSAWASIFESIVILVLGILLLAWPGITFSIVSIVVGVVLIIAGIYRIANYFISGGQKNLFDNSLLFGVISILIGVAAVCFSEELFNVLRIIFGIWLIYESLVRINTAIKLHAIKIPVWGWVLAIALVMLVVGVFILFFDSNEIIQVVGGCMILAGIFGIIGDIFFVSQVDEVAKKLKD